MRVFASAAFAAFLLLLSSSLLAAEQPWNGAPFSGDPKATLAAAEAVSAGDFDAVVLLNELHYTFGEDGRATSYWRLIFRLAGESAVDDWSTVAIEWAPWYQERPEIAVRVIAKDGTVHMLDPKAVVESAARDESDDIFSDNRILRAPLPGIGAGAVVEQVTTYRDRNPLFDTGTYGSLRFGRYVPVENARLVIDAPANLELRFVNKSAPKIEPVRTEANGRQHIVFESGRLPAIEDYEWNLPPDESAVPYIAFSTGRSWQEIAHRYAEIVEKQLGDPASIQPFLRSAIGKATDRREIVKKALAAIQKNVRYAGVEVGAGSIVPRSPKEVLSLKYGDCKDKATLLVSMLRAAGIPADVALLSAGTGLDIDASLPGVGGFNHVIVRVGGDDPFWVDPTDEYSPAGTLPISDQDRLALIASRDTTDLVRTPAAPSTANFTRETRTIVLAEEGKGSVTEVTEAVGGYDAILRRQAAVTEKKSYRESLESYVKSGYGAESLKNFSTTDPRDLETPFRLTLEAEKIERGQTTDIDAAAGISPSALTEMLPWSLREDDKEEEKAGKPKKVRTRDFVVAMPYVKEYVYRVVPPLGFTARTLPASETKQLGTASLVTKYEVASDGAVLATLRFDSGKRRLTPAEMEETRKAVVALREANWIIVGFDSIGWAKLSAGDIGGGISEFRRLATLHPKEALHHVQMGRAYFLGGMGEASREELRRAIALDPKYAQAHRMLGIALQHDLLAREFRKGFDLDGAVTEYRKARELDPKNVAIRSELARLLTRGKDGEQYSEGARLAEAIDEFKAIATDLDDASYEGELLTAMAHAGRFDEMKTRARDVKDNEQRLSAMVVATTATDGIEAGMREAASVDTGVRRTVFSDAFQKLLRLRRYPEAATLLDEATKGTTNATQVRSFIDMLRRAKRLDQVQLGDDPKSLGLRIMILGSTSSDLEKDVRPYTASWLTAYEDRMDTLRPKDESSSTAGSAMFAAQMRAREQGLPARVATEIGMGAYDVTQDGSDATMWRVRVRPRTSLPGGSDLYENTFYVVRENDRYVVAATGVASMAVTALHFLEKNDLDAARLWLNTAREEVSAAGGDDPLGGPSFPLFWAQNKETATADEIRAALAQLLLFDNSYVPGALPLVLATRESVPEALRPRVDYSLAAAYSMMERRAEALPIARRVYEGAPDSPRAFRLYTTSLIENEKLDEARKIAKARLDKKPHDADALRVLYRASAHAGDYDTATASLQQVVDHANDPESGDYNDLAWSALFTGKAIEQAIEHANHAVASSGSSSAMHTLAALYAEAGKSLEARTKLLEAMDTGGREEPSSYDWYVLGRIAENYGATDAAVAAYKHVTVPKNELALSSYELTQRRLKLLTAKR